jgi:putative CocE/NonD family hydrolase
MRGEKTAMQQEVEMQWGVKIPLRDGILLNATLYLPTARKSAAPVVFTLTPYIAQTFHEQAVYFAAHGLPFLCVDVRGRGNSEGVFSPYKQEAADGHDVVEWIAAQPYCDGQVTMWGGSYAGYDQWVTAKEAPPHLRTIVPVASPHMGVDFPIRNNMASPYLMQWLMFVSGRTSQERIFGQQPLWNRKFLRWLESGVPFKDLDGFLGQPSDLFQEWIAHPHQDAYWDSYNPTPEEYSRISIPVLTITGSYDGDQPGALTHYRRHVANRPDPVDSRHFLVIGPWDHAGTRVPRAEVGGLKLGSDSLVDLGQLHLQWYAWIMQDGPRPAFLKDTVAYYVMGAEKWRYAASLEAITATHECFYLTSNGGASHVFSSGSLMKEPGADAIDSYVYDPRDLSWPRLEAASNDPLCLRPTFPLDRLTDQRSVHVNDGKQLIYHSAPFAAEAEVSGFFALTCWMSIDQPDTDIIVSVHEIDPEGGSLLLATDCLRARYRRSPRVAELVVTNEPLRYEFCNFNFISRMIRRGSRLRLVLAPANSIFSQRNYNSGGVVAEESIHDARTVTVRLHHGAGSPGVLHVPLGQRES